MKGLFHRLAARTTGTTAALRSDALLAPGGAGPDHNTAAANAMRLLSFDPRPPTARVPTDATERPDASHDPFGALIPRPAPSHAGFPRTEKAPWLDGSADDREPETVPETTPLNLSAIAQSRLIDCAVAWDHGSAPSSEPARESLDEAAYGRAPKGLRPESDLRIVREPPLLIRQTITERPPAPAPVVEAVPRTPARAARDTGQPEHADVHIHIGCIEVTAAHEPAAPRRQGAPIKPPMSLDAYLAKRGRG
jgi:hypothetical protein